MNRGLLAAAVFALAPVQCPSRRGPELAHEDTPGDALWALAERFEQRGDPAASRATLEFLAERYPSSRFAPEARRRLGR
jgi:TolA-binding protein